MLNKQTVIDALERMKDGTKGIVAATISDCQKVIGDLEYEAQEREKIVVQLRKQWQDAEMFICTMCGHFDHKIDGNIVYGNKDCGEISGYPYCKKFTPWIPTSVRLPDKPMRCLVYTKRGEYGGYEITYYNQGFYTQYAEVTHWMQLPELPQPPKRRIPNERKRM